MNTNLEIVLFLCYLLLILLNLALVVDHLLLQNRDDIGTGVQGHISLEATKITFTSNTTQIL